MLSFAKFINEKTFQISGDVDRLFNKFYKKPLKLLRDGKFTPNDKIAFNSARHSILTTDTSVFKSSHIKMANKARACRIYISIGSGKGMTYSAKDAIPYYDDDTLNQINIDINKGALDLVFSVGTIDDAAKRIQSNNSHAFRAEFGESKVKASIYHELSHWLQDILHNGNINKTIKKAKELNITRGGDAGMNYRKHGKIDINFTNVEIDAQIHALKQLRRDTSNSEIEIIYTYFDEWIRLNPSMNSMLNMSMSKDKKEWLKKLFKRAIREKLIPRTMKFRFV